MQIVIPMSGFGERFRRAGYDLPKPMIPIDGKPIIAHVIDLFPGETEFIFVCNETHLNDPRYEMRGTLKRYCPTGRIVGIPPHKSGPVHAVYQVVDAVDMSRPVIINYCDFCCYWDWHHFVKFVAETECAGAIPAYRGFHPHSLGTTNYAYMQEADGWVTNIREKQPFTDDRMQEFASSGTYYFANGALMRDALRETMARDLSVNGEYYVSLAYKPLLEAGKKIAIYELQHFMQWGTPEDVTDYKMWSDAFRRLVNPAFCLTPQQKGAVLVPMAGLGARFSGAGYTQTKPLIPVSGKPMAVQATRDLPRAPLHVFVLRQDMPELEEIRRALAHEFPDSQFVILDSATEGQACSALAGYKAAGLVPSEPLTIGACDSGAIYNTNRLQDLLTDRDSDVIVWVARGYPNAARRPDMYGWAACAGERVIGVSVKTPLADPGCDPIITGAFTFRRASDFERAVERMIARRARINGEYYLDTCIEDALALGLTVRIFEIDNYLCWGTPNDLRTFEYWQSCFHKWDSHPYRLNNDVRIAPDALPDLLRACRPTVPTLPNTCP